MLVKRAVALFGLFLGLAAAGCVDMTGQEDTSTVTENIGPGPTNLTATVTSSTSIHLSWDPEAGATGYVIQRSNTPGTETNYTSNSPPTATTFNDSHLSPNTQYCYVIRANVTGLGVSDPSNEVCVTTTGALVPPSGVTATAISSSAITISWSPVANATAYYVYISTGSTFAYIGYTTAPTTTFTATGLQPSTTYTFEVRTVVMNSVSGYSSPASATTFPAGLEGYYRFDDKTGTSAVDSSGYNRTGALAGSVSFSATNQSPVRDVNDHNPSNLLVAAAGGAMSSSAITTDFGADATILFWAYLPAAPTGDIFFAGQRASGCGNQRWAVGVDGTGLFFSGAATAKHYFGQTLSVGRWTHIAVTQHAGTIRMYVNGVPATTSAAAFTSGPSVSASFQVGNIGGCSNAGPAQIDELRIYSRQLTATEIGTFGVRPAAVTTLATTEIHSNRILLGWSAPANGADKYYMWRGTAAGNETFLTSVPGTTFTSDHLTPSTQYSYVVFAQKNGLVSDRSNEVVAATLDPPPPPANLTGVISTCCTPKRVNLSWTAEPRAVVYLVYQSDNGGAFIRIGTPTATTFQTGGLTSGHSYQWYVKSQDDGFTVSTTTSNVVSIMIP